LRTVAWISDDKSSWSRDETGTFYFFDNSECPLFQFPFSNSGESLIIAAVIGRSAILPHGPQTKSIESLCVGDYVLAADPDTGEVSRRRVAQLFHNAADHLRVVTIRDMD